MPHSSMFLCFFSSLPKNLGFSECVCVLTPSQSTYQFTYYAMYTPAEWSMNGNMACKHININRYTHTAAHAYGSTTLDFNFQFHIRNFHVDAKEQKRRKSKWGRKIDRERERELDRVKFISGLTNYLSICLLSYSRMYNLDRSRISTNDERQISFFVSIFGLCI